jgi:hypothetical protein
MGFKSRKFRVGLISLGAVLAVYLLYSRLSKTPPIDVRKEFADTVADSNIGGYGGEGGRISGVDVEDIRKARFTDLDKETKEVIREWGFEKLLHDTGKEWEIEKPYMNIFRRSFKYYITSDKGKVQVETVAGKVRPKGVTLTENVVIHILPENDSGTKESFLYLDEVDFTSEKSQFSTTGPVKFVSQDIQMLGRGLELVYNEELARLEFLRISHLESLHLKVSSEAGLFSSSQTDVDGPADTNSRAETQQPNEPAVADDSQKTKPLPAASTQAAEQTGGKSYRCVLSKNVVIKSPYDLVFADDEVCISNIFRPKVSDKESDKADISGTDNVKARDVTVAKQGEPNESEQELADIVVTCDGGVVVTPMGSLRIPKKPAKPAADVAGTDSRALIKALKEAKDQTVFIARKIDYCAATGNTVASGPSELTFYTGDLTHTEAEKKIIPVKVTARKKAEFFPALNQAVFEGDCVCTILREDSGFQQKYTLSGQKLTVNISEDKDRRASDSTPGIDHLTTSGGVVRLVTLKTAGEKLLGGVELKCVQFDYDTAQQLFLATGPGKISLHNSRVSEPNEEVGRFSLRRPCWVIVEHFDTLKYFLEENRIVADAGSQEILINYIPVVDGQYGQLSVATASHVEAFLYQTADGLTELSTLTASGGIFYEDEDNQFVGSELFYDHNEFIMKVKGDELQPCYFNGALVDGIEYNVKTAEGTVEIIGPGALQMKSKN